MPLVLAFYPASPEESVRSMERCQSHSPIPCSLFRPHVESGLSLFRQVLSVARHADLSNRHALVVPSARRATFDWVSLRQFPQTQRSTAPSARSSSIIVGCSSRSERNWPPNLWHCQQRCWPDIPRDGYRRLYRWRSARNGLPHARKPKPHYSQRARSVRSENVEHRTARRNCSRVQFAWNRRGYVFGVLCRKVA